MHTMTNTDILFQEMHIIYNWILLILYLLYNL